MKRLAAAALLLLATTLPAWAQINLNGLPYPNAGTAGTTGTGKFVLQTSPTLITPIISSNTTATAALPVGTVASLVGDGTNAARVEIDAVASNGNLTFRRTNTSLGSPSALASADNIGIIAGFGYGTTGYSAAARATAGLYAGEAWSDTAQGTYFAISTTGNTTTTTAEQLRLFGSGGLEVGNGAPIDPGAGNLWLENASGSNSFRLFNVLTDASNGEWFEELWASNVLTLGTNKNGAGSVRNLQFEVGGSVKLDYGVSVAGQWVFSSGFFVGSGSVMAWNGRSRFQSPSDGVIEMTNNAVTDFTRLQFGGTTSSFPSLKRSSTTLAARLADDSADSPISASGGTFSALTTGTNADTVCLSAGGVLLIQAAACTISSLRFKDLKGDYDSKTALDAIAALHPIVFTMKAGEKPNADWNYDNTQIGLSAENVAAVEPRCAIYEQDGQTPKSYRPECLIGVLISAVNELRAR